MSLVFRIIDNLDDFSESRLAEIIEGLPQWRRDVVMRYKYKNGKKESALAFHLLQQMLVEENLMSRSMANQIEFVVGEHGKPQIKNHEHIHFNLSHCKNAVACVVGDSPVGIDVECIGRYSEGVARYSLSESEFDSLCNHEDGTERAIDDLQLMFTKLWTKKEALLKLLGTGITDDIKTILPKYQDIVDFKTIVDEEKKYVCTVACFRT